MAKRREPGQKEYNPLDDARGRLPIDDELIRAVVSEAPAPAAGPAPRHEDLPLSSAAPAKPAPVAPSLPMDLPPEETYRDEARREEVRRDDRGPTKRIVLEKLNACNKFLTTQTEKFELERLTARVSGALGASVNSSQLIRACLVLLLRAENEVIRRAERQPRVKRPSNTEAVALAEFDQMLAEILSQAFRDAGPLRTRK